MWTINDNDEVEYRVTLEINNETWTWRLLKDEKEVGFSECEQQGTILRLVNIDVTAVKKKGLGWRLLALIIKEAMDKKLTEITGILVPSNLKLTPDLPRFYEKSGFEVRMNENGGGIIRRQLSGRTMGGFPIIEQSQ